jgi:hypothetical protein
MWTEVISTIRIRYSCRTDKSSFWLDAINIFDAYRSDSNAEKNRLRESPGSFAPLPGTC